MANKAARAMKKAGLRLQDLLTDMDRQRDRYNRERDGMDALVLGRTVSETPAAERDRRVGVGLGPSGSRERVEGLRRETHS